MLVVVQARPFNAVQLRDEIAAAGVSIDGIGVFGITPFSLAGDQLTIRVADGSDENIVRQVFAAHVPPVEKTPAQLKRKLAARVLDADDAEAIRLKALVMAMSEILNDLASRIIARQNPRTWSPGQIADVIRAKITGLIN